jgi:molecular chaperone HscB
MARDYFSLFNIEPSFTIDETALEQVYHSLLSQFHPDRYAGKPQVEQRVAAQLCADINAGYRTLQGEVSRAQYLLQHSGVDLQAAEREGVGADFLMTQILLRERLETIAELDQVGRQTLVSEIDEHYGASRDRFAEAAQQTAWQKASRHWQEMCYLEKLVDATGSRGR